MKKGLYTLLFFILLFFTGCSSKDTTPISDSGFYFDTVITLTLYGKGQEKYLKDCFALADKYEALLSPNLETSDVWKINHANGKPTVVSAETALLIETAIKYAKLTDGRIDPTIGPLSELWGFTIGADAYHVPSDESIKECLPIIDYNYIKLDTSTDSGPNVTLTNKDARIDLGFLAKGYIADKMKEYLVSKKVKNGIINLGGNVLTIGEKPDGSAYKVGIQKPYEGTGTVIAVVPAKDQAVITSGIYERYFEENGETYHHILDKATGYPINNGLISASIRTDSSMEGDALATSCLVLGPGKAMELVESMDGYEALFITEDFEIIKSSGMEYTQ